MRYFHEAQEAEIRQLVADGKTWGDVSATYSQPSWCSYPNALNGQMGCWSLTGLDIRLKISEDFCKGCDCFCKSSAQ